MSGSYNAGQFRPAETRSFQANFSKLKGAHSIEFGLEWREYREQYYGNTPAQAGTFNFSTNWTKGPLDNSTAAPSGGIGQGLASLLLGLPIGGSVAKTARRRGLARHIVLWSRRPENRVRLRDQPPKGGPAVVD